MAMTLLAMAPAAAPGSAAAATERATTADEVELVLFWGAGCPHCAAEREFLVELEASHPSLVIRQYEVFGNEDNQRRFEERAAAAGTTARYVPTTFVGDRWWVGFDDTIATEIEAAVTALEDDGDVPGPEARSVIEVPLVGGVDVGGRSLVLSTLLIGFVDGVNPCSLWVLSVLLALVLHGGSRRRVALVGVTFLLVTAAMYGLYIVGFYSALRLVRFLPWVRAGIAIVVGTLGVLQLQAVVAEGRGPTLGVPGRAKPGMYQRMRRLAEEDRSLPWILGATGALAVGVSLMETPCTIGLPLLWTDLLARNDTPLGAAVPLFLLYLAAFLIDELIVFAVVVATMRAVRLQEHHGRALKIVSGVLMIGLALVMLVRPTALDTVGGALAVFAVAAGLAAVGLWADRGRRRRTGRSTSHSRSAR